ncbi:hypothetical protein [Caballeronia sp. RCC_10]|uniref:hypothetical protein n=1 Tax=Caballeronia sp. RCC_10 TaxID=3239227 RepID=UPI003524C800
MRERFPLLEVDADIFPEHRLEEVGPHDLYEQGRERGTTRIATMIALKLAGTILRSKPRKTGIG